MIILTIIQSHHHQDHHNFYHLTIFYNAITLIDVQGGYGQVNDQKTRKRPSHENYDVDDFTKQYDDHDENRDKYDDHGEVHKIIFFCTVRRLGPNVRFV